MPWLHTVKRGKKLGKFANRSGIRNLDVQVTCESNFSIFGSIPFTAYWMCLDQGWSDMALTLEALTNLSQNFFRSVTVRNLRIGRSFRTAALPLTELREPNLNRLPVQGQTFSHFVRLKTVHQKRRLVRQLLQDRCVKCKQCMHCCKLRPPWKGFPPRFKPRIV